MTIIANKVFKYFSERKIFIIETLLFGTLSSWIASQLYFLSIININTLLSEIPFYQINLYGDNTRLFYSLLGLRNPNIYTGFLVEYLVYFLFGLGFFWLFKIWFFPTNERFTINKKSYNLSVTRYYHFCVIIAFIFFSYFLTDLSIYKTTSIKILHFERNLTLIKAKQTDDVIAELERQWASVYNEEEHLKMLRTIEIINNANGNVELLKSGEVIPSQFNQPEKDLLDSLPVNPISTITPLSQYWINNQNLFTINSNNRFIVGHPNYVFLEFNDSTRISKLDLIKIRLNGKNKKTTTLNKYTTYHAKLNGNKLEFEVKGTKDNTEFWLEVVYMKHTKNGIYENHRIKEPIELYVLDTDYQIDDKEKG